VVEENYCVLQSWRKLKESTAGYNFIRNSFIIGFLKELKVIANILALVVRSYFALGCDTTKWTLVISIVSHL